jgi:hypothetical protein
MTSRTVTANSAGTVLYSPWIRLNTRSWNMNAGFTAQMQQGATGNYSIQVTQSDPEAFRKAQFSRVTTTLTITCVDGDFHGLQAADAVNLRGTPWDNTGATSLAVATATNTTVFTVTVANSGPTSGVLEYAPLSIHDLTSYAAVTGDKQGTLVGTTEMIRVIGDTGGSALSGKVNLTVNQAGY